jgi:hypothetical protein
MTEEPTMAPAAFWPSSSKLVTIICLVLEALGEIGKAWRQNVVSDTPAVDKQFISAECRHVGACSLNVPGHWERSAEQSCGLRQRPGNT